MVYFLFIDDDRTIRYLTFSLTNEGFFTVAQKKPAKRQRVIQEHLAGEQEVTICRRRPTGRRKTTDTKSDAPLTTPNEDPGEEFQDGNTVNPDMNYESEIEEKQPERRKVQRRRQIDPTTCERDYTDEEIQFMHALDTYKRSSGRMFPTCSEILEVVRGLGYEKVERAEPPEAPLDDELKDTLENTELISDDVEHELDFVLVDD